MISEITYNGQNKGAKRHSAKSFCVLKFDISLLVMDAHTYRSRINNPCDHLFWQNRGYSGRPHNWKQILQDEGYYDQDIEPTPSAVFNYFFNSPHLDFLQTSNAANLFGNVLNQPENRHRGNNIQIQTQNREAEIKQSRILNPHDVMFWQKHGYKERPKNYKEILKISNYWVAKKKGLEVNIPSPQQLASLKLKKEQEKEQRRRQREENPEDDLFWKTRGYPSRPTNWEEIYKQHCDIERLFQNLSTSTNKNQKPLSKQNRFTNAGAAAACSLNQPGTSGLQNGKADVLNGKKLNKAAGVSQPKPPPKKDVAEEIQDLCKLCWENPLNSVILECAHIATCFNCGQKLTECPICRKKITRIIRTFKA